MLSHKHHQAVFHKQSAPDVLGCPQLVVGSKEREQVKQFLHSHLALGLCHVR